MSPNERNKKTAGGSRGQRGTPDKQKSKRTTRQKILWALYIILTVISALIVAGFIFWNIFSAPPETGGLPTRRPQPTTTTNPAGEEVKVDMPALSSDRKKEFYTFLLVGQDTYGGGNTDTVMMVSYNVPEQELHVMSLPRDTYVEYNGRTVLLNSVYNRAGGGDDGIEALKNEIGDLTGVTPDYHVIVQWSAVGELVDAFGGVYFEVPKRMYYNDLTQHFKIDLQKGYQLLDGAKAMQLIRYRLDSDDNGNAFGGYATGDLGRIQTQQAFMKAVIAKCLQPDVLLPNLTEYIRIFQENVVTNLTASNMAYFAKSAVGGLDMDNVDFVTLPNKSAGNGHLLPVGSEIVEAINDGFNPYKEDIRLGELKLATKAPASSTPKPANTPEPPDPVEPDPTDEPGPVDPTPSPTPGEGMIPEDPTPTPEGGATPSPGVSPPPSAPPTPSPPPSAPPAVSTPEPTPAAEPTPPPAEPPASGPGMEPVD
ncbi:MAG: LCP family protein [Oscillospiraceae bacterium]|nr:LCP family protein [Oscillospiraceae bacterium]